MSSSCLSGGRAAAYRLDLLDLDMIKSPSSTSWISSSSSPSSTTSEFSNCPLAISTRKPRTPRKRPNQTYKEAAAILSMAYPKLFPAKHLTKPNKLTKAIHNNNISFQSDSSDLLLPFRAIDGSGFLIQYNQRPDFSEKLQRGLGLGLGLGLDSFEKTCRSLGEMESDVSRLIRDNERENFEAESIILDEEIEEGINCILGNLGAGSESIESFDIYNENSFNYNYNCNFTTNCDLQVSGFCYGYPVGLGFEFGLCGVRKETRNVDAGDDWWRFPTVSETDSNPKAEKSAPAEKTKKKIAAESKSVEAKGLGPRQSGVGVQLKLNYEGILSEWSDKLSPFAGEGPWAEIVAGNDVQVRLAQIDLFSDNGGMREASVLRYKEKRRNRLLSNSKKIRYQVRKVNADRRPRMKGRFVRAPNSSDH